MNRSTSSNWSDSGTFVVFGGTGGIGSALVRELLHRGAQVVLASRNSIQLDELDVPGPMRERAQSVSCDVTDPDQIAECIKFAADAGGGVVSGVALCVGSILLKPAHRTTDDEWEQVLTQNLTPAFYIARAAGKSMRNGGSVVFCSSAAAAEGLANHDAIAAAKAGIEGLVRSAAASYAARGLRFNAVAPGLVRTHLADPIISNPASLEASTAMHALGRIGEPEDVASALVWLLDPSNDWVTGHILRVDGGLSRVRPVPRR